MSLSAFREGTTLVMPKWPVNSGVLTLEETLHSPACLDALRVSNRAATGSAEVRARIDKRAALAAEPSAWRHRHQPHRTIWFRRDGPHQSNHPADHRPSQEHVEQDDSRGVALIAPNDGRQEIQKNQEKQGQHSAPLSPQPRRGGHPSAPLSHNTLPPPKMFLAPPCPPPSSSCSGRSSDRFLGSPFAVRNVTIVGAPTWIRDVVVTIGAGTTRRAAVASGAGMIEIVASDEWLVASKRSERKESGGSMLVLGLPSGAFRTFSNRLKSPGLDRRTRSVADSCEVDQGS